MVSSGKGRWGQLERENGMKINDCTYKVQRQEGMGYFAKSVERYGLIWSNWSDIPGTLTLGGNFGACTELEAFIESWYVSGLLTRIRIIDEGDPDHFWGVKKDACQLGWGTNIETNSRSN